MSDSNAEITITLELHPALSRVLASSDALVTKINRAVLLRCAELIAALGIPGELVTQNVETRDESFFDDQIIKVAVNDEVCSCSGQLLRGVFCYVSDNWLDQGLSISQMLSWLLEADKQEGRADFQIEGERLTEFLSMACQEIIKWQPFVLLGSTQLLAYRDLLMAAARDLALPAEDWLPAPDQLFLILRRVLLFRISLLDRSAIVRALQRASGHSWEDMAEELLDTLSLNVIEIHLSRDYLCLLTIGCTMKEVNLFREMRTNLFQEAGMLYPELQFVTVDSLKPYSFMFKINHLTTYPWIGAPLLFSWIEEQNSENGNETAADGARAAENDASGGQQPAQPAGMELWNKYHPMASSYLLSWLRATLVGYSYCFITRKEVKNRLSLLTATTPRLNTFVQQGILSVERVTQVLRMLIVNDVSIRNLSAILERMLEFDYMLTDPANPISFEEFFPFPTTPDIAQLNDPRNIAFFVKEGLKRYLITSSS
ncbi:MAG TPA: FHIPEP family type III secretion protein [Ktedonobacteraceae bacterium]|nr:FHIPEP family type III secretion protein [Ktedonobacteraceae bacterium]